MDGRAPFLGSVEIMGERVNAIVPASEAAPRLSRASEVIECGGRLLLPGFVDAHMHLLSAAAALAGVDCSASAAPSIEAILERLRESARDLPPGAWVRARGYHEAMLAEARHPTRGELDRAVPANPVRLIHASGHASVLNTAALTAVGIGSASEEPPGAGIDREGAAGEPSGLLIEMEDWLDQRIPSPRRDAMPALVERLGSRLLAAGVTSVQDLGHRNDRQRAAFFSGLIAGRRFRPRLTLATGYDAFAAGEAAEAPGIAAGPVKIMLNESGGKLVPSVERLGEMVHAVHAAGRQVAIHAIEARAVAAALDVIEAAQRLRPRSGHRHRVEHASITPQALAERMAGLGVVAVSNPAFLWQNGDRYLRTVPPCALPNLYDIAGLRRAGVRVAAGSDAPVAPPEPLLGIVAACTRLTASGRSLPGETLAFERAAELFTRGAAYAGFREHEAGEIAPGRLADLVLLDGDARDPRSLRVRLTMLSGQIVWKAPECSM